MPAYLLPEPHVTPRPPIFPLTPSIDINPHQNSSLQDLHNRTSIQDA